MATFHEEEYKKINIKLDTKFENKLGMSANYAHIKVTSYPYFFYVIFIIV